MSRVVQKLQYTTSKFRGLNLQLLNCMTTSTNYRSKFEIWHSNWVRVFVVFYTKNKNVNKMTNTLQNFVSSRLSVSHLLLLLRKSDTIFFYIFILFEFFVMNEWMNERMIEWMNDRSNPMHNAKSFINQWDDRIGLVELLRTNASLSFSSSNKNTGSQTG